jgi:hypothetical protein
MRRGNEPRFTLLSVHSSDAYGKNIHIKLKSMVAFANSPPVLNATKGGTYKVDFPASDDLKCISPDPS